jgi:hypothetical protein
VRLCIPPPPPALPVPLVVPRAPPAWWLGEREGEESSPPESGVRTIRPPPGTRVPEPIELPRGVLDYRAPTGTV